MLLRLHQIDKSYPTAEGPLQVLHGIDLSLEAGKSLALTGESGSGKSTLLHLVAGLDSPDAGEIHLGGKNIVGLNDTALAALRRGTVGLVFQRGCHINEKYCFLLDRQKISGQRNQTFSPQETAQRAAESAILS